MLEKGASIASVFEQCNVKKQLVSDIRKSNQMKQMKYVVNLQGGPIKCYHFSIIPKFSNVNLFKIFIQRFVIRNIKPTFNINEFVKSELCRERNKDLCSVCV